jgi:hypothetical protein
MVFCKQAVLNLDKTNVTKFIIKISPQYPLNIGYNDKYTDKTLEIVTLPCEIYFH